MRLMLPLAKLAFQYTQAAPAQITKYCQQMNRLCAALKAVNLGQLLLLKKQQLLQQNNKTQNHRSIKTLFFFLFWFKTKTCFQLLRPKNGHRSPLGSSTEKHLPPKHGNLSDRPSALPRGAVLHVVTICTGPSVLNAALLKATRAISTLMPAPQPHHLPLLKKNRGPHTPTFLLLSYVNCRGRRGGKLWLSELPQNLQYLSRIFQY